MVNKDDFNEDLLKEKVKNILDDQTEIQNWNNGLWIKSLILSPIIIFSIGLFVVNRPENLMQILFVLIYPLVLILIGVIILFLMRSNLE